MSRHFKTFSIRLPESLDEEIEQEAEISHRSKNKQTLLFIKEGMRAIFEARKVGAANSMDRSKGTIQHA